MKPLEQVDERKGWLERRKAGIGGSEAASVLGLSPYKSAFTLWSEKVGLLEPKGLDSEWIEWGQILEEPIARKYSIVTGRTLIDHGRFAIRKSAGHPIMICTSDREIVAPCRGILSIKNVIQFAAGDWDDDAPVHAQIQLQHELIVWELLFGSIAALLGGNHFRWMDVEKNERFCSFLIEQEQAFWDLVQRGTPPAVDGSKSTKEALARLYPKDAGTTRVLPQESIEWAEKLAAAKDQIREAEKIEQEIENLIKAAIGDATFGELPGGAGKFSWKHTKRKSYTVEESEFRVLRTIKK